MTVVVVVAVIRPINVPIAVVILIQVFAAANFERLQRQCQCHNRKVGGKPNCLRRTVEI